MYKLHISLVTVALCQSVMSVPATGGEETAATWNEIGEKEIEKAMSARDPIKHRAKNVILFLGDGMGVSTVTAARILRGGEESLLSFEHFPNTALSKTYCADTTVTDSAASSTAYQAGVKINKGLLGLDQRVARQDCVAALNAQMQLTSIADWSLAEGKSVGLVTTTRITHATPAGAYANSADRDWEGDSWMPTAAVNAGCRDIALQLIEDYPNIQVIMGGGRQFFLPNNTADPNTETENTVNGRLDNRDLTQEWLNGQTGKGRKATYAWNAQQLRQIDLANTDYLLGLFAQSHMDYEQNRTDADQPSLPEMAKAAITILSRNPKGFYLLVEGGRIDHSHHENSAYNALHDTLPFADAVETAVNMTSEDDTLIVTTADHSHTMVIAGYQSRGHYILDVADAQNDTDGNHYTTLLYGVGPGYRYNQSQREDLTNQQTNSATYRQEAAVHMVSSTHGGEDVAIYARGPMAHLFRSVHEENYIAHVMAYASCVGRYKDANNCPATPTTDPSSGAGRVFSTHAGMLLVASLVLGWVLPELS